MAKNIIDEAMEDFDSQAEAFREKIRRDHDNTYGAAKVTALKEFDTLITPMRFNLVADLVKENFRIIHSPAPKAVGRPKGSKNKYINPITEG